MIRHLYIALKGVITLFLLLTMTTNLQTTPPVWWDEGWNLSVARNWIELGHYGRLLDGKPIAAGLSTGFPAVAPVAISLRLFGIGIWQGRVVGLIFALGAFVLIYLLARHLYNKNIAVAAIIVLVLMSPKADLNPILTARQVLGEMPMLFYLLSGYCFLLLALQKSIWFIFAAIPLWALALTTKVQPIPFWFLSLLLPFCVSLYGKRWNIAGLLFGSMFGSILAAAALHWGLPLILLNPDLPHTKIVGIYSITALAALPYDRRIDVLAIVRYALPTLLALCYVTRHLAGKENLSASLNPVAVMRLALWTLSASWFGWYFLLSMGWERYLFPAIFIGSIFVAAMLNDLTNQFSLGSTVICSSDCLRKMKLTTETGGALLAVILVTFQFALTAKTFYQSYVVDADQSVLEVADFLNTQTPEDALIETYDSELFFLLNRRYHYPPDQIHVDIGRRRYLLQNVPIKYDPLAVDPDYLVIGPYSGLRRLYDPVLDTGQFRLLQVYGPYVVYERTR